MEIVMNTAHSDAIALLKANHRKVEDLFAKFETAKRADQKQQLVKQICTELTVHTIIEEEIFYPAC
jgi:hemerythrin superfamily protein